MAAAESDEFGDALHWQGRAIEAAAGRTDLLDGLRENYRLYERQEPCRVPWRDDDPILSPGHRSRGA